MQSKEISIEKLLFDPSSLDDSRGHICNLTRQFYERLLKRYSSYIDERSRLEMEQDFDLMMDIKDTKSMWQFLLCGVYMDMDLIPILNQKKDVKFLHYMSKVVMPRMWGALIDSLGSNPDSLLHSCNVLYNMWSKEDILTNTLPIVVRPTVQIAKAEAPPPAGSTAV